ncbi:MAG: cell division protein SepF [Actinomycetales bacterium]|nr:cell division protein SepF [Actinomycetales bacterium]
MAVYLGLVEEDDQVEEYDDYQDARRDVRGRERRGSDRRYDDRYADRYYDHDDRDARRNVRPLPDTRGVRTIRQDVPTDSRLLAAVPDRRGFGSDLSRIETVHPRSYNDARRIGEDYREGVPVIMNLSELDEGDAKRIVDFAAGLVFALHGTIERITKGVFLLSPANVDVGEAAREQVAQDGFYNQS